MKKLFLLSFISTFAVSATAEPIVTNENIQIAQTSAPRSFQQGQGTLDSQVQQQQMQAQQAATAPQVDSPFAATQSSEVITVNDEELPWLVQKKEPTKNPNNLIRLKFDEAQESITADDKTALKSVVNRMLKDYNSKAILKAYAALRGENSIRARQAALRRVLEIRKFFEENGVDFKRFSVQVMGDQENSLGLDYIDIDKI